MTTQTMQCALLTKIVNAAVQKNTPDTYHEAQAAVAILQLTGSLCEGHTCIAINLVNTTDELAPLFAETLKKLQRVEKMRLFVRRFSSMFPNEPDDMPQRIFEAAAAGNSDAKMLMEMLSVEKSD